MVIFELSWITEVPLKKFRVGRQIFALYFRLVFGSPQKRLRSAVLIKCMNHLKPSKDQKKFFLREKAKQLTFLGFFHFVSRAYFLDSSEGNRGYHIELSTTILYKSASINNF